MNLRHGVKRISQLLVACIVVLSLVMVPYAVSVTSSYGMASAVATPKPGKPGGNSSKPGDNKKKDKKDDKKKSDKKQSDKKQSDTKPSQRPSRSTSKAGPREPHTEYPGRRGDGNFTSGNSGLDGRDEEELGFSNHEERTGQTVIRRKVRVTITDKDGVKRTRYYDGLVEDPDSEQRPGAPRRLIGLEHKVRGANRTKNQKIVDGLVKDGVPARGKLDGQEIEIVDVEDIETPRIPSQPQPEQATSAAQELPPPPQPQVVRQTPANPPQPQQVPRLPQAPVVTAAPEVPIHQPAVEVPPVRTAPELPAVQSPPEVPVTRAPVEMPPVSAAPQTPLNIPGMPATVTPRPAAPPQIGAPVNPTGMPLPPNVTIPTPKPVGTPRLPGWSTPAPGPVLIPNTADPLASLRLEGEALQRELNTLVDRVEALQAMPNLQTTPTAVAELDALSRLKPLITQRQAAIGEVLAHPPAELAPPKSAWQKTVDFAEATGDVVGRIAVGGLSVLRNIRFVPIP